jgi:hypothetical protein
MENNTFSYGFMTGFLLGIRTQQGVAITQDQESVSFTIHGLYLLIIKIEWMITVPIEE